MNTPTSVELAVEISVRHDGDLDGVNQRPDSQSTLCQQFSNATPWSAKVEIKCRPEQPRQENGYRFIFHRTSRRPKPLQSKPSSSHLWLTVNGLWLFLFPRQFIQHQPCPDLSGFLTVTPHGTPEVRQGILGAGPESLPNRCQSALPAYMQLSSSSSGHRWEWSGRSWFMPRWRPIRPASQLAITI